MNIQELIKETDFSSAWKNMPADNLKLLQRRLMAKHNSMPNILVALQIRSASNLKHVLANRECYPAYIAAIQNDQELSDEQVLKLWPLLKTWPKENLRRTG